MHKLGQAPNPQPEGQWSEPVRDTQVVGFLGKPGAKNPSRQHHRRPRIPSIRYYLSKSEVPWLPPRLPMAARKRAKGPESLSNNDATINGRLSGYAVALFDCPGAIETA